MHLKTQPLLAVSIQLPILVGEAFTVQNSVGKFNRLHL